MPRVKIIQPENRLAKILNAEGDSSEQLIAVAERRLEDMSAGLRPYVLGEVARIVAFQTQEEDVLFTNCLTLGDAAMNVTEVAGAAGLPEIGHIARGIRAMTDSLVASGIWHTDAVKVHIAGLALLTSDTPPSSGEVKLMLARLQDMRAALGISE